MKEKIYTIPVSEAFEQDCECPVCLLEKKLEDNYVNYYLGPSLMESDCRIETNKKGFCQRHYKLLYDKQENRLGLALITDTHLKEKIPLLEEISKVFANTGSDTKGRGSLFRSLKKSTSTDPAGASPISRLISLLVQMENNCTLCDKLNYTMERYMDVIMYLWSREKVFREIFASKKGFCLVHLRQLAEAAVKYLKPQDRNQFINLLMQQQLENLDRLEKEVEWFTKKFDYRYNDAPWGNSKDALPRAIQKLKGYSGI